MDTIFRHTDGFWYFWGEAWAHEYGPYNSKEECEVAFKRYCELYLYL